MASPSTVRSHPQRARIDAALDAGESNRSISRRFGLSEAAVRRYRSGATRCAPAVTDHPSTPSEIPAAALSPQGPAGFSPASDPFDILSVHYPWRPDETPRPDPLAAQLRDTQRQSGTNGVRSAVLGMIGQYEAAGLPDETLARKLDTEPWQIAAWRREAQQEAMRRLAQDPHSLVARELMSIEARERRANQRLLNPNISEKAEASCNAALNQCARQKIALLQAAGVSLGLPPQPRPSNEPTLAQLQACLADECLRAGADPSCTLPEGVDALAATMQAAWDTIDSDAEPD